MREYRVSADLQGITELTLIIPVKTGMVDAVGTMTYATRLRLLLATLGGLRKGSQDISRIKPFSDTVERIQFIHSFRLNLMGDSRLLLAVAFDGPWEPYMRSIWRDLGSLLDVIMCNCVDYPLSVANPFAVYDRWIRKYQVPANFFYIQGSTTAPDLAYLREVERISRETHNDTARDRALADLAVPDPEKSAQAIANANPGEVVRQGLQALLAIHAVRPWYSNVSGVVSPVSEDAVLLRAIRQLLKEWRDMGGRKVLASLHATDPKAGWDSIDAQYDTQLRWFDTDPGLEHPRQYPAPVVSNPINLANVQGGILIPYQHVQTGCLLLLRATDPAQALNSLAQLPVTTADAESSSLYLNVAITWQGLSQLGLDDNQLTLFPEEFRVGMEKRARLLGDVYENHPANWKPPQRNWPAPGAGAKPDEVQLSMVDVVIQLRSTVAADTEAHDPHNTAHPLHSEIGRLAALPGLALLHVQPLVKRALDLFGFEDQVSQPVLNQQVGNQWDNNVAPGELLLGFPNDRDRHFPAPSHSVDALLHEGTFLVVRKLQQNTQALKDFLLDQQPELKRVGMTTNDLKQKMMGRCLGAGGLPLVQPAPPAPPAPGSNNFNFQNDPAGSLCPFQAHMRRTNPRLPGVAQPRLRVPRILRRGMSYGPERPYGSKKDEEGLLFMAYNASITNQFEVIQRWISGGNSSGGYSGQADPFLGIPQPGEKRTFRCQFNGKVARFDVDTPAGPRLLTQLRWGLYLFVPSISALRNRLYIKTCPAAAQPAPVSVEEQLWEKQASWQERLFAIARRLMEGRVTAIECGREVVALIQSVGDVQIERLLWKAVLEERTYKQTGLTAATLSFIRLQGGVLDTAFGVIVANYDLMLQVLRDDKSFVVDGTRCPVVHDSYRVRMEQSIGQIYLGLDAGQQYSAEATLANAQIGSVTRQQALQLTLNHATQFIAGIKPVNGARRTLSLFQLVDHVLAQLCRTWFAIPDGQAIKIGGQPADAADRNLHCPFHYTAPSRYFFLPQPDPFTVKAGQDVGKALYVVTLQLVQAFIHNPASISGTLIAPLFALRPRPNPDLLARTIIGMMLGLLPTVTGNILPILNLMIERRLLWRIQSDYLALKATNPAQALQHAGGALIKAMQADPSPEMIWRVALGRRDIGGVDMPAGKKVVLNITSAVHELQEAGKVDVSPAFGGIQLQNGVAPQPKPALPTHACPGYEMAIGVMLGFLVAVLEAGALRPTPTPLVLELVLERVP